MQTPSIVPFVWKDSNLMSLSRYPSISSQTSFVTIFACRCFHALTISIKTASILGWRRKAKCVRYVDSMLSSQVHPQYLYSERLLTIISIYSIQIFFPLSRTWCKLIRESIATYVRRLIFIFRNQFLQSALLMLPASLLSCFLLNAMAALAQFLWQ